MNPAIMENILTYSILPPTELTILITIVQIGLPVCPDKWRAMISFSFSFRANQIEDFFIEGLDIGSGSK